jgi:hypothetical protein
MRGALCNRVIRRRMEMRNTVLALVVVLAGGMFAAVAPSSAGNGATLGSQLASVRAATAKYHRIDVAIADGFVEASPCVEIPGLGGMGHHYVNPARIDNRVSIQEPEILVYAPMKNGKLRLVAVEYVMPVALSPTRPALFGRGFDDAHDVGAPWGPQWDLHAWVWHHNPDGTFAPFNPDISCD